MRRTLLALSCSLVSLNAADVLVVAHKWADSVGFYDAATGAALTVTPAGLKPHEFALSADGRWLYVTNYGIDRYTETAPGANTLTILDMTTRRAAGTIDLGRYHRPHGIERLGSGRLYVTSEIPPTLLVVDPASKKILEAIPVGRKLPHMVAVSPKEDLAWTADAGSGTVTAIDLRRKKAVKHIPIGGIPMGLALVPDARRLYAVNRTGNLLVAIDTARHKVAARLELPGHPARVHATPDGKRLLVSLIDAGDVAIVSAAGLKLLHRFRAGTNVEGLGCDAEGRFGYASAQGDNKVIKFSLADYRPVLEIPTQSRPDPILILPGR